MTSTPDRSRQATPEQVEQAEDPGLATLARRSWWYVLRKAFREFGDDKCTTLAAALTYYSVLAIFPAALALLSLLGLFGQSQKALSTILDVLRPLVSAKTLNNITPVLHQLANSHAAGFAFLLGLLGALWSASGYVSGFSTAMNTIYEVDEGRPFWKLRPTVLAVTVISIVMCALAVVILIVSGPVATSLGNALGIGSSLLTVWKIVKWPVLVVVVVMNVAILYWATPNVKYQKFRVLSVGAFVAILVWVVVSVAFAFYVANFSSYNKTYGSLAGVIVTLLWLWLTNLALLFGAEVDSELERARELHGGLPAEEQIQLPLRDERGIKKAEKRRRKDFDSGREIRDEANSSGNPADRPFARR
jgi:membrane protein